MVKVFRDALGLHKNQCWRTPLSGGHLLASAHAPGDLQFAPEVAAGLRVSVECKNHANAKLDHLLRENADDYWAAWLRQAAKDAAKTHWRPVLLAHVGSKDYAVTESLYPVPAPHAELRFTRNGRPYRLTGMEPFAAWLAGKRSRFD